MGLPLTTVASNRDRSVHLGVELPVLTLPDQADLLELRRHRVPGDRPRVLEARNDPQRQPRISLKPRMARLFQTMWFVLYRAIGQLMDIGILNLCSREGPTCVLFIYALRPGNMSETARASTRTMFL